MERKGQACSKWLREHWKIHTIIGCMILALIVITAALILTKDKAQPVVTKEVQAKNSGCEDMKTNPLTLDGNARVTKVVQEYYGRLAENTDYAEAYHDVQVYVKKGIYKDTYVVFARYRMKIKDIYTELPGLGTLYVTKNKKNGKLYVDTRTHDTEVQDYIGRIAEHEDVKTLMSQIRTDYESAVASDALLQEVLRDLEQISQQADQDSVDHVQDE